MGLTSTIYVFEMTLSDVDRGVFDDLRLTVAQHPSESVHYLLTRLLAYCLEITERIAFSRGLGYPDEPAIWAHDRTGKISLWVDVGAPSAERLHRANKQSSRVVVYNHKLIPSWLEQLSESKIHRANEIEIFSISTKFLEQLEQSLHKRNKVSLSRSDGELYVEINGQTYNTTIDRHQIN